MNAQLAIDVGATGIKGALVDVGSGSLISDRIKYTTPSPALPHKVLKVMNNIIEDLKWTDGDIGIGFPAVVKNNLCFSASNIDESWINIDIQKLVKEITGLNSHTLNDADAAGIAEVAFGKAQDQDGSVIMLTLGSGIGSGLFKDGELLPNVELGRMIYRESVAEHYASNRARKTKDLSWDQYGEELNEFLQYVNRIFTPDLMVIGGGISKKFSNYSHKIDPALNVTDAALKNNAGIIGAAMYAMQMKNKTV